MSQAASLDLVDTEYSACSVSCCPNDRSLVATGLYQVVRDEDAPILDEASPPTKRLGRCLLSRMDPQGKLQEIQRIETAAILDMAWSAETDVNRLAAADAAGQITLYDFSHEQLVHRQTVQIGEPGRLALSLDWDNRRTKSPGSIVASVSDGSVSILSGESSLAVTETWHAHDYEPWIAAWDYWDTSYIWTGGDDCKLKLWDARQGFDSPTMTNSKNFTAGVTSIQNHTGREGLFAVGSYDGVLRLFDKRNIRTPLAEHDVGGGIWRVRWHPTDAEKLLVACMHDGFKVVNVSSVEAGGVECSTQVRFDEHGKDALAYGVDWCEPMTEPGSGDLVASCSFYDHQLRSWTAPA